MKPHIAFAVLMLSLTPVLAQNTPDPQSGQSAPPPVAAQPSEQQSDESAPVEQPSAPTDVQAPEAAPPAEAQAQESQPSPDSGSRRPRRSLEVAPAVRPRADALSYPVSRNLQQFSIGARLLSPKEVEQKFSTPLGKHYLVVEVAVYPSDAQTVRLRTESFTLRAGNDDQAFFPALPEDIARGLSKSGSGGPRNVAAYPTVGVGYEDGPWGRGVSTGVGVGVGSGPYPRRGSMGNGNARVMERELQDKSIPEGNLTEPTAGYLYFPLPEKRAPHYNLELTRKGETVSLALPEPKK